LSASRLWADDGSAGFSRAEDFAAKALNARYFAGRADGSMLRGGGHLMRATV
jgi:hypothetical protein